MSKHGLFWGTVICLGKFKKILLTLAYLSRFIGAIIILFKLKTELKFILQISSV